MSEGQTSPAGPLQAERTYARSIGWTYLGLAVAGVFTNNLWHMFTLSTTMTGIHLALGISGLTVALRGGARAHRAFNLTAGVLLTAWGVTGTVAPTVLSPYPLPLENAFHVLTGIWGFYGVGTVFWGRFGRSSR